MTTLRSYLDADQHVGFVATPIMTDDNQHEVRCGMCARELFVDDATYESYTEAINTGLDNPFRCERCSEEYDDLAYEG